MKLPPDLIAILVFTGFGLLLISIMLLGSRWLRKRSELRGGSAYGRYERLVSFWMLFGVVMMICMLSLAWLRAIR